MGDDKSIREGIKGEEEEGRGRKRWNGGEREVKKKRGRDGGMLTGEVKWINMDR